MKISSFDNILTYSIDSEGQIEKDSANVNDLLMKETNQFEGWECWAGLQNITIDNNGNVWRAICRQGESLGSIHTDFDVASDTVICRKKKCTCAADLHLSKAMPEHRNLLRAGAESSIEKSFCAVPWIQISTKTSGAYRACCLMSNMEKGSRGILRGEEGRPLHAGETSFADAMNNSEIRRLRQQMLRGVRPEECQTCWRKEDLGLPSKRTVTNKSFSETISPQIAFEKTSSDGFYHGQPVYFDLRFGNLCNLKCVMCHPASSSRWYEDYSALTKKDYFTDAGEKVFFKEASQTYNWHDSEIFWQELERNIPFIQQIYLVGGEPLLIERHYKFLELCVDRGYARQIVLEYDTNLTLVRNKVLSLWEKFKKVILRVSLEDVGERNDYIRHPSKWDAIVNNLDAVQKASSHIVVSYSITWQILNSLTITDLWKYLGTAASTRILSHPSYFDVAILPQETKQLILTRLDNYARDCGPSDRKIAQSLSQYIQKNLATENRDLLRSAVNYLQRLDHIRGTNYRSTFPDVASQLEKYFENET